MRHQLGVLAAALLAAGVGAAQQPRPTFRTAVEIVHLDVSVLDSNRRPVRCLRPEDFTILQDGQPQSIAVFQAVDTPEPAPGRMSCGRVSPRTGRSGAVAAASTSPAGSAGNSLLFQLKEK